MNTIDWKKYEHFSEQEEWGNPSKMREDVIIKLQSMRYECGKPIKIHCGTQGQHSDHSYHRLGYAVDCHIGNGMSLLEQFLLAEKYFWGGIGLYPSWNNPGLHLDIRNLDKGVRWVNYKDKYLPLNASTFQLIL